MLASFSLIPIGNWEVCSRVLASTVTVRGCFRVPLICFFKFFFFVLCLARALRQADVSMVVPSSCCRLPWDPLLLAASSRLELHVKAARSAEQVASLFVSFLSHVWPLHLFRLAVVSMP